MEHLRNSRFWCLAIGAGMLLQIGACAGFDFGFFLLTLSAQTATSVLVEEAARSALRALGLAV